MIDKSKLVLLIPGKDEEPVILKYPRETVLNQEQIKQLNNLTKVRKNE